MKLTSAGESHGQALCGIIEGLPSNMPLDIGKIDEMLCLRQGGYGRGARQKIERDKIKIISGVRNLLTLGSPLCFLIENKDYENWKAYMAPEGCDTTKKKVENVRPGHADLSGLIKYGQTDARNILERASARETAVRVAAGAIAMQYLSALGVDIGGYVCSVCGIKDGGIYTFGDIKEAKGHPLFMLNTSFEKEAMAKIDEMTLKGDTLGGEIEIRVHGLKAGFGSCMTYSQKLDARLAAACMSVQAIKGVEIGDAFANCEKPGSLVHDEIFFNGGKFTRLTNNAGGIEGGMSNGEEIVLHLAMKPIPTLRCGLETVNYNTHERAKSAGERSDVCAICAAEVILESVVAFEIMNAIDERVAGDTFEEVKARYAALK